MGSPAPGQATRSPPRTPRGRPGQSVIPRGMKPSVSKSRSASDFSRIQKEVERLKAQNAALKHQVADQRQTVQDMFLHQDEENERKMQLGMAQAKHLAEVARKEHAEAAGAKLHYTDAEKGAQHYAEQAWNSHCMAERHAEQSVRIGEESWARIQQAQAEVYDAKLRADLLEQELSAVSSRTALRDQELSASHSRFQAISDDHATWQTECQELKQCLVSHENCAQESHEDMMMVKNMAQSLQTRVTQYEAVAEHYSSESHALQTQMSTLRMAESARMASFESEHVQHCNVLKDEARAYISSIEARGVQSVSQLSSEKAQTEIQELKSRNVQLTSEVHAAEARSKELCTQIDQLRNKIASELSSETLQSEVLKLKGEVARLYGLQQQSVPTHEFNKYVAQSTKAITALQSQLTEQDHQIAQKDAIIADLQAYSARQNAHPARSSQDVCEQSLRTTDPQALSMVESAMQSLKDLTERPRNEQVQAEQLSSENSKDLLHTPEPSKDKERTHVTSVPAFRSSDASVRGASQESRPSVAFDNRSNAGTDLSDSLKPGIKEAEKMVVQHNHIEAVSGRVCCRTCVCLEIH